jgi:hypothetical protein
MTLTGKQSELRDKVSIELLHFEERKQLLGLIRGSLQASHEAIVKADKKATKRNLKKASLLWDKFLKSEEEIRRTTIELGAQIKALAKPFSKPDEESIRQLYQLVQIMGLRCWDAKSQPML